MIYWVLHKRLTKSSLNNPVEGWPYFFYQNFENFTFIDISDYTFYSWLENINQKTKYLDFVDTSKFGLQYKKVNSKKQLKTILNSSTENDIFVFQSISNIRVKLVLKEMNKRKIKSLALNHWQLSTAKHITKKHLFLQKPLIIFQKILFRLYSTSIPKKLYFDFVFSSCKKNYRNIEKKYQIRQHIPCHSVPYDEFITLQKNNNFNDAPLVKEKYYVFIDQALTIHPDGARLFSREGKLYYEEKIPTTLQQLSEKLQAKIVIAEHPRCQYKSGHWKNFDTFKGKTDVLIKYSAGVIGHYSTSIYLAYFYAKKIIFLVDSNPLFPYSDYVRETFEITGGKIWDMSSNSIIQTFEKKKSDIEEYFSLVPNDTKTDKEILLQFLAPFSAS